MRVKEEIKRICRDVKFDEPLSKHTSFRIGGPAKYFVEVRNRSELANLLKIAKKYNLNIFVIGAGTNLLVKDKGIKGLVIKLSGEFKKIDISGEKVKVGGGVLLPQLLKFCARNGLGGVEFLAGIPGTVGGAIMMNAGNPEIGIGNLVDRVEIMTRTGKEQFLKRKDLRFSYRRSSFPDGCIILSAELVLKKMPEDTIMKKVKQNIRKRREMQPTDPCQAGSIFKNPKNNFAGRLIELAGLKGLSHGDAYVSGKHANFIVNRGRAKARDVLYLIRKIKNIVKGKFGIELELEIKIVG